MSTNNNYYNKKKLEKEYYGKKELKRLYCVLLLTFVDKTLHSVCLQFYSIDNHKQYLVNKKYFQWNAHCIYNGPSNLFYELNAFYSQKYVQTFSNWIEKGIYLLLSFVSCEYYIDRRL